MCFFRKKKAKSIARASDPFGLEKRRKDAEIIALNVKVGDMFHRSWSERRGSVSLRLVADYTVTRIDGDLITLEAPHEEPLQLTKEDFKYELTMFMTKIS